MTQKIAIIGQKGGVSKSSLTRALSTEASKSGYTVRIADLDVQQATTTHWHRERLAQDHEAVASVEIFKTAEEALQQKGEYDLVLFDGAGRASKGTTTLALACDLVVLPSCSSLDDLRPAVSLAHELVGKGVPAKRILFVLTRVSSLREVDIAKEYISMAGYSVSDHPLVEKPSFRTAQNMGLSVTEVNHKSLRDKAIACVQSIFDHLSKTE